MGLVCPNCKGQKIDQYRMPTGPIFCKDCGFKVANKEVYNPFIEEKQSDLPTRLRTIAEEMLEIKDFKENYYLSNLLYRTVDGMKKIADTLERK